MCDCDNNSDYSINVNVSVSSKRKKRFQVTVSVPSPSEQHDKNPTKTSSDSGKECVEMVSCGVNTEYTEGFEWREVPLVEEVRSVQETDSDMSGEESGDDADKSSLKLDHLAEPANEGGFETFDDTHRGLIFYDIIRPMKPFNLKQEGVLRIYLILVPEMFHFATFAGKKEVEQELEKWNLTKEVIKAQVRHGQGKSPIDVETFRAGLVRIAKALDTAILRLSHECSRVDKGTIVLELSGCRILLAVFKNIALRVLERSISRATVVNAYKRAFGKATNVVILEDSGKVIAKQTALLHYYGAISGADGTTSLQIAKILNIPHYDVFGHEKETRLARLKTKMTEDYTDDARSAYNDLTEQIGEYTTLCEKDLATMVNRSPEIVSKFIVISNMKEGILYLAVVQPLQKHNFLPYGMQLDNQPVELSRGLAVIIGMAKEKFSGYPDIPIRGMYSNSLPKLPVDGSCLKQDFHTVFLSGSQIDAMPRVVLGSWLSWDEQPEDADIHYCYRIFNANGEPVCDLLTKSPEDRPKLQVPIDVIGSDAREFKVVPVFAHEMMADVPLLKKRLETPMYFHERAVDYMNRFGRDFQVVKLKK